MALNTIKVKKYSDVVEEYEAAAAITPGMLIEYTSAGKVQAHSSVGEFAEKMFALENELEGEGISDAYASGDQVQCWIPYRGDQVYALLSDGENVAKGDPLESNGDGYLQKAVAEAAGSATYPDSVVAVALEAVDMSGSSGADPSGRIIVRVV
jgi:hypothetical protein